MDWLSTLVTRHKIPVGEWCAAFVGWLGRVAGGFFDAIASLGEGFIDALEWTLQAPPPVLLIALASALTFWLQRSWKMPLVVALGLLFILNQGYWLLTTQTLALVIASCAICMAIGVPVGIAAAHRPRLSQALDPLLDLMQTLPAFVYLIPAIVFFGLGAVPGLLATIIFVLPAPIRLTRLGVQGVPKPLLEAADSFGATWLQKLLKVELPAAAPQILAGLTQAIMLSLSMVVISALVGANGLGVPVVQALNRVNAALGFEAGLVIVAVAIVLDRMLRGRKK